MANKDLNVYENTESIEEALPWPQGIEPCPPEVDKKLYIKIRKIPEQEARDLYWFRDERKDLINQILRLRKALAIYGDKSNWNCSDIANITGGYDSLFYGDFAYRIAQEALKEKK